MISEPDEKVSLVKTLYLENLNAQNAPQIFNNLKTKIIIKHQQYAKYHGKHWSYLKDLNKNIFCSSQLGFTNLRSIQYSLIW